MNGVLRRASSGLRMVLRRGTTVKLSMLFDHESVAFRGEENLQRREREPKARQRRAEFRSITWPRCHALSMTQSRRPQ